MYLNTAQLCSHILRRQLHSFLYFRRQLHSFFYFRRQLHSFLYFRKTIAQFSLFQEDNCIVFSISEDNYIVFSISERQLHSFLYFRRQLHSFLYFRKAITQFSLFQENNCIVFSISGRQSKLHQTRFRGCTRVWVLWHGGPLLQHCARAGRSGAGVRAGGAAGDDGAAVPDLDGREEDNWTAVAHQQRRAKISQFQRQGQQRLNCK